MAAQSFQPFQFPYSPDEKFGRRVAYFSMEFAVHQALKIYSGGLGFLAGSHIRSAFQLKQHFTGIGILWKYGYYDQVRKGDQSMDVLFQEKLYSFLEDTGIVYKIRVHQHPVWVKAWYLPPERFKTAPLFLLSTDLPENDYLSQTITHRIYDADTAAKIAQYLLLGIGGAKLLDILGYDAEVYHLNEAHGLPAAFYLYQKLRDKEEIKKRLVFTTHTPEEAGNEKHDIRLLDEMGYFGELPLDEVRSITGFTGDTFNHSLAALRFARLANGVSRLHGEVAREMWGRYEGICPIISITNAQDREFWADKDLYRAMDKGNDGQLDDRKKFLKRRAFDLVADQTGDWFEPGIFTLVWARRFAGYKRPDLITQEREAFTRLLSNTRYPVQIIWAGKPYPMDYTAISTFNSLVHLGRQFKNCAVMAGYELALSKRLKQGADVWLNNPRVPREASGTSGMTAAMNGAVNFSTDDGWIPEFIRHGENGFLIPQADYRNLPVHEQDRHDLGHLYRILETEILPLYYDDPGRWREIMKNSMRDVREAFDSRRMAGEYYEKLYA